LETDEEIRVPQNTAISIMVTSNDVLHSFAIPSLGVKIDACPGRINQTNIIVNRPGIYNGQCSEICGTGHGFMPINVFVMPFNE
jgi:heme/copper-type cytochrome/quinol oxidase subunit 2